VSSSPRTVEYRQSTSVSAVKGSKKSRESAPVIAEKVAQGPMGLGGVARQGVEQTRDRGHLVWLEPRAKSSKKREPRSEDISSRWPREVRPRWR